MIRREIQTTRVARLLNELCTIEALLLRTEGFFPGYPAPSARFDVENVPCRIVDGPDREVRRGGTQIGLSDSVGYFATSGLSPATGSMVLRDDGRRYKVIGKGNPSQSSAYFKVFMQSQEAGR